MEQEPPNSLILPPLSDITTDPSTITIIDYSHTSENALAQNANDNEVPYIIWIKTLDNRVIQVNLEEYDDKKFREMKANIFSREIGEGKTIRLIYQGRILQDEEKVSETRFERGFFIHAMISDNPHRANNNNDQAYSSLAIEMNPLNNDEFFRRRGFDYYLSHYTEKEVERLREIWHMGYNLDHYNGYRDQMYQKEEQLIQSQGRILSDNLKHIRQELEAEERGSNYDFIIAALLGYAFNFFCVFLFVLVNFNQKIKTGALFGFLIKLLLVTVENTMAKDGR
jgi:hypothetical protein